MATIIIADLQPVQANTINDLHFLTKQETEEIRGGDSWGWEGNGGGAIREMNTTKYGDGNFQFFYIT